MNYRLTNKVKEFAHELGADLVGVANIERFENAPVMMSPQGILPAAKSVVVCAIHHPDACIELGGEPEPQDIGPYSIQYVMNDKMDVIAYKVGRMLDDLGYKTVPIASSNIWRYRGYKDLEADFAPDISHIYTSVAAGLSQMGWNGLAITPEYGARNRYISIITEAELEPTPLYDGPDLCDMCGECINNCPTNAFRKEVDGVKKIKIEDKEYEFANKNLWRCAWGEHFDLDLNLDIPDEVDEDVILQHVKEHGIRGGEFGVCLRVCLPPHLRYEDPDYTRVFRRKRHMEPADIPVHRSVIDKVTSIATDNQLDELVFLSESQLEEMGVNVKEYLPDGQSAILLAASYQLPGKDGLSEEKYQDIVDDYKSIASFNLDFAVLDISRELEKLGYTAIPKTDIDDFKLAENSVLKNVLDDEREWLFETVITSAKMSPEKKEIGKGTILKDKDLNTANLTEISKDYGADLVGITSVDRLNNVLDQIKKVKEGERIFDAEDKNIRFKEFNPEVTEKERKLFNPEDYMDDAKSVIVLGLHYPEASVERAKQPPAEAVGPYVFAQYETERLLGHLGYSVVKELNRLGFNAVYSHDLLGIGSQIGSPRGPLNASINNTLEAVTAGIGTLTYNGNVFTEEFGLNQRFVTIVTDADLEETDLNIDEKIAKYCADCQKCIEVCPAGALIKDRLTEINIAGSKVSYLPVDTVKCEWSSKYALCGEDGFQYIGSKTNEIPPAEVEKEDFANALKESDPVLKHRPVTAESCIVSCPLAVGEEK